MQPFCVLEAPDTVAFFGRPGITQGFAFAAADGLSIEAPAATVRLENWVSHPRISGTRIGHRAAALKSASAHPFRRTCISKQTASTWAPPPHYLPGRRGQALCSEASDHRRLRNIPVAYCNQGLELQIPPPRQDASVDLPAGARSLVSNEPRTAKLIEVKLIPDYRASADLRPDPDPTLDGFHSILPEIESSHPFPDRKGNCAHHQAEERIQCVRGSGCAVLFSLSSI